MRDVNKVMLIGRLGKDPEVVNFDSGTKKVSFPLATGESYTNPIYIEGKIRTRNYDDKDGNKRYITEIEVENLSMLGSRPESQRQSNPTNNQQQATASQPSPQKPETEASFEDDLPF